MLSSVAFVLSLSHIQLSVIPWTAGRQAFLSFTISWSLLKLTSIQSVMPSNHLIPCCPFLPLPSIFPSIKVFPIDWFSSISPSNEYSGLIFFKIDWFDFLAVQGTLKSLVQNHGLKASILQHSAFFMVNSHIHTQLLEKP